MCGVGSPCSSLFPLCVSIVCWWLHSPLTAGPGTSHTGRNISLLERQIFSPGRREDWRLWPPPPCQHCRHLTLPVSSVLVCPV